MNTSEGRIKELEGMLRQWEDFFCPIDYGDDFPQAICVDYTSEQGIRRLLIEGRKVLKEN
jgi:hypothetical protein